MKKLACFMVPTMLLQTIGCGGSIGNVIKDLPIPNFPSNPSNNLPAQYQSSRASNSSPVEELAKKDIRTATNIGNIVGLVTGGVAGNALCKKYKDCANNPQIKLLAIAAAAKLGSNIGSAFGNEIGETAANRRRAYATEHAYLESEIAASEKAIATREQDLKQNDLEITEVRRRIAELQAKQALTAAEIADAKKIHRELTTQKETNNILLVQYNEKIAYLDHALKTSELSADAKQEDKARWKNKYVSLKDKRDELTRQRDGVETQNALLSNDQKILEKIIT